MGLDAEEPNDGKYVQKHHQPRDSSLIHTAKGIVLPPLSQSWVPVNAAKSGLLLVEAKINPNASLAALN